jgi:hypothetical protein
MISIEKDAVNKERFEFNLPYKCIDVMYGPSIEELPKVNWGCKSIVWLDYDGKLSRDILTDIMIVTSKIFAGSILLISVNAENDAFNEHISERLDNLKQTLGENKVPCDINTTDLNGWNTAKVLRRIINNEIQEAISGRNGVLDEDQKLHYRQLFHFNYKDDAKMLTVGGIFFEDAQTALFEQCGFKQLEFIREASEPFTIEVPNLTIKEIRRLDEQLPAREGDKIALQAVPKSDIDKYSKIYRYFPAFSEFSW